MQQLQQLSPWATAATCTAVTCSYVGSLYLVQSTRVGRSLAGLNACQQPLRRDDPLVVRARLAAVSISTMASLVGSALVIQKRFLLKNIPVNGQIRAITTFLGLRLPNKLPEAAATVAIPLILTMTLFLGPLYTTGLDKDLPLQKHWSWGGYFSRLFSIHGCRNFIIAPITEELVFRSCIIGLSALGGQSKSKLVFLTPLYFGIAHVHHAYEVYKTQGRTRQALINGVLGATFQFVYTSLFGFYASFLNIRTGSVLPPILAHVFCNHQGFPALGAALANHPDRKLSIAISYMIGIAGFSYYLFPATEPSFYGGSIFWR